MRLTRLGLVVLALALPGVVLAPIWRLGGLGAGEDDILYYYPQRLFLHDSLQAGHLPWFDPWSGMGRPFVADPQAALWYPATWLLAVLPPIPAYAAALWLHFALAFLGTYRLLRTLPVRRRAAVFGGIAFAFSGFLLAHRAHLSMQHAAAWIPWVFWALLAYARVPLGERRRAVRRLVVAALIIALACLAGHVQIAALAALGTFVWLVTARPSEAAGRIPDRRAAVLRWLVAWTCAAGLFAIQWLPTFLHLRHCTRVERGYLDFVENSWNPASVVNWWLPMLFGQRTPNFFDTPYWGPSHQCEQFAYAGIVPLALALLALRPGWRSDRRRRPWIVLAVFAMLLALGTCGPICPVLYWLPGSSVFRCPARALVLVNLCVAVLAAVTLNELAGRFSVSHVRLRARLLAWTRRPWLTTALVVGVPLLSVLCVTPLLPAETRGRALAALTPWRPAVLMPLITIALSLLTLRFVVQRWHRPAYLWLLVLLTTADLAVVGWTLDVPAGARAPDELLNPRPAAAWMEDVRASGRRLWVVNARRGWTPGEYVDPVEKAVARTNYLRGIESFTDYGPLQPSSQAGRFGLHPWGESWRAADLLADTGWMRFANVGWILLCDPHAAAPADCEFWTTTAAGWRLYHNPSAAGAAMFAAADQPGAVRLEWHGPNAFTTWADTWPPATRSTGVATAPAAEPRLVVSLLNLPGWTARTADGPVPIETIDGLYLGARLAPGEATTIDWEYMPPGLTTGAIVSALSLVALLLAAVGVRR